MLIYIPCIKPDLPLFCFALKADPNTLFRSNSLSSKAMEQFMKVSEEIYFTWAEIIFPLSRFVSEHTTKL